MIDQLSTKGSDEALDEAILPWTSRSRPELDDAEIVHASIEGDAVDAMRSRIKRS